MPSLFACAEVTPLLKAPNQSSCSTSLQTVHTTCAAPCECAMTHVVSDSAGVIVPLITVDCAGHHLPAPPATLPPNTQQQCHYTSTVQAPGRVRVGVEAAGLAEALDEGIYNRCFECVNTVYSRCLAVFSFAQHAVNVVERTAKSFDKLSFDNTGSALGEKNAISTITVESYAMEEKYQFIRFPGPHHMFSTLLRNPVDKRGGPGQRLRNTSF
ncbi:hypothetical protein EVAR_94533_1 [Eumeta japonica]|uniref:Uncharacterized protein n=1 Tax=Eumeta variegata TaxID=151549 RepID=A0A4C1UUW7_EUMVA|nr:hypothetical protein EVAR_94533_1 [Eumeta japonica]